jgi:hypothetical protein
MLSRFIVGANYRDLPMLRVQRKGAMCGVKGKHDNLFEYKKPG